MEIFYKTSTIWT